MSKQGRSLYVFRELLKMRWWARQKRKYDTFFPLPQDARSFTKTLKTDQINFQTSLSLQDVAKFYRQAFANQGLVEIDIVTVVQDEIISLAFADSPNDKKVIVQVVDLGYHSSIDMRNVNLRTEQKQNCCQSKESLADMPGDDVKEVMKEVTKEQFKEIYLKLGGGAASGWSLEYWNTFFEDEKRPGMKFLVREPETLEHTRMMIVTDCQRNEYRLFFMTVENEESLFD